MAENTRFLDTMAVNVDSSTEASIRKAVNAYSNRTDKHPFGNYGNRIKVISYDLMPTYICTLASEFDNRAKRNGQMPYKGQEIEPLKFADIEDVDVWKFSLQGTAAFADSTQSFTVTGSKTVRDCRTCGATGKVTCGTCRGSREETCPSCQGRGTNSCRDCGGSGYKSCRHCNGWGYVYKTGKREVRKPRYNSDGSVRYVTETETYSYQVNCPECGGSKKVPCQTCGGSGDIPCRTCHTEGTIPCRTCGATGKVTCGTCHGYRKNMHYFVIDQKLHQQHERKICAKSKVMDIGEFSSSIDRLKGRYVFDEKENLLPVDLVPENGQLNRTLNGMLAKHHGMRSPGNRLLFQQARIFRSDSYYLQYRYDGKDYDGVICNGEFYPGVSPVTEFSDSLIGEAEKALKGHGVIKARKILDIAESLRVHGSQSVIGRLKEHVERHLDVMFSAGSDIVMWLMILFLIPSIYAFYNEANPVIRFVSIANRPGFWGYDAMGLTQSVIAIALIVISRFICTNWFSESRFRHRINSGFLCFLSGAGTSLATSVLILGAFMALNFLGLGIITSLAGAAIGFVVKLAVSVVAIGIVLVWELISMFF